MAGGEQDLNLVTLDLVLQRYPGTAGSDADRANADVEFKVKIGARGQGHHPRRGAPTPGLGYELGRVDGAVGIKTGIAVLQLQADIHPLDTLGDVGHGDTQDTLKHQLGERVMSERVIPIHRARRLVPVTFRRATTGGRTTSGRASTSAASPAPSTARSPLAARGTRSSSRSSASTCGAPV